MFKMQIETDNAAFQDGAAGAETARILRLIADRLESGSTSGVALDYNGNKVGAWALNHVDETVEE